MKIGQIVGVFLAGSVVAASNIPPQDVLITAPPAVATEIAEFDPEFDFVQQQNEPGHPHLEKRVHEAYVEKQKAKLKAAEEAYLGKIGSSTSEGPKKWLRTIYGSVKEIVTPTVVAGVTISAQPPKTTNGLEPWISIGKRGTAKTIVPKLKDGHIKNASPTYGTWFSTPTTIVYTKEELKAHNMADDEVYEHAEWIEEDQTYHELNPLIRCTPDYYFKKGINKQTSSEPFCSPHDNSVMYFDKEYFITWYSRHFDAEKVRFHLSGVKPSSKDYGLKKRSAIMDNGGRIKSASFYVTDWLKNDDGWYPIKVLEEFFTSPSQLERKVLLSIQPDNVPDDEFDLLQNSLILDFKRPNNVHKQHNEDIKVLDQIHKSPHLQIEVDEGLDYEKYFVILGIPTFVVFLFFGMFLFVKFNKVDLSHLKQRKAAGKNHNHRRIPFSKKKKGYTSLPQHTDDIRLKDLNKTD